MRSESNVADLKSKSVRINGAFRQGQLEFALVPDFLREGEIAKALAGITAIIHIASPLAIEVCQNAGCCSLATDKYNPRAVIMMLPL